MYLTWMAKLLGACQMSRKLHIGGRQAAPGWEIFNIVEAPGVDHLGDARDLSRFPSLEFSAIYASHIFEHIDYQNEMLRTIKEWSRVLEPGGTLYISVPDMDTLCRLFLENDLSTDERFQVMRMMFGGHMDPYDYHLTGLNFELLTYFLRLGGFVHITSVDGFDLFDDDSVLKFKGVPISLNVIAHKPA